MNKLLSRTEFRESVFSRDFNKCVMCSQPGQDAHHIIERRLFQSAHELGGYFINNGATVCGSCHLLCESTDITPELLRSAAGITKSVLPEHLYEDQVYDKWGNIIMPNGTRLRGELFNDESVQKIIADHLHLFTHYVKAPRTWHLPWSPGMHDDDKMLRSLDAFIGQRVIVSAKIDGENTTAYSDHIHARSLDSDHHESRSWVKQFWSTFAHDIPEAWRIVGENVYAEHSIHYTALSSYFLGFQVWNERNICMSWDDTIEWLNLLGITPVIVLYDGIYDEKRIRAIEKELNWDCDEGYVMRTADAFSYGQYKTNVGKFVRKDHIRSVKHHWKNQAVVKNLLKI